MSGLPFIIRVYGLYTDPENGLLVSDEYVKNQYITKFPGGGLEFGEGLIDCLKREMMEETGQEFDVLSHFYTVDYYVPSFFDDRYQVISVYYLMKPKNKIDFKTSSISFDFLGKKEGSQSFRFIPLKDLRIEDFTLIIDQTVAGMFVQQFRKK